MRKKGAGKNTWDAIGLYNHRISNSLSVIPRVNLTSNIGTFGLHANGITEHHFRSRVPQDDPAGAVYNNNRIFYLIYFREDACFNFGYCFAAANRSRRSIRGIFSFDVSAILHA